MALDQRPARARRILAVAWISALLVATSATFALSSMFVHANHPDRVGQFEPIGHRTRAHAASSASR
ncbi:MAG TPA: hypothetical protein VFR41_11530, partial [Acidimicrobiia bacterium]|nr:hypothetical protein [Acidimicrobiia bacterium]